MPESSRRVPTVTATLMVLAFGLSGCSLAHPHSAQSEEAPQLIPVTRSTPAAVPDLGSSFTQGVIANWVGDDYTFDAAFTMAAGQASSEIADAAPGQANVKWSMPISIMVTNTTPGRISGWPHMHGFEVAAYWQSSSPACQYLGSGGSHPSGYCGHVFRSLQGATGDIAISASESIQASLDFDPSPVPEASATAVVAALSAGPDVWVIADADGGGCGSQHIMWASDSSLSCAAVSSLGPSGAQVPTDLSVPAARLASMLKEGPNFARLSACPFSKSSFDLAPGMLSDSFQTGAWDDVYIDKGTDSAFPKVGGVACSDGGMTVGAYQLTGVKDVESYLSNIPSASWPTVSDPIAIASGQAWVASDSITPVSGSKYDITRFAWANGSFAIVGKLVGSTPSRTVAWLKYNLGSMMTNLSQASPTVVK